MNLQIGNKKIQFFTARPVHFGTTYTFTVYLIGIMENYQIRQMDGLLSQQLLSSTQDADMDFHLIDEEGRSFPVHKWMMAARSPVLGVLLNDDKNRELNQVLVNCNAGEMNQLIKFIYTGEFEGFVSYKLMQLAIKFGIRTLQVLGRTTPIEVSLKEITKSIARNWELGFPAKDYVFPV